MRLASAVLDSPEFAEDRSLSAEGSALRKSLVDATAPPSQRANEILERVLRAALKTKEKDDILVDVGVFARAVSFMNALPVYYPVPTVVVESEDEIGLDWDEGTQKIVSLTVDRTPMVGFAALFGEEPLHGSFKFALSTPDTLRFLLGRLYPKHF
jgi:hypothetical protein